MDRTEALNELKAKLGPLDAYLRGRGIDIGANGKKYFRCLNPDHPDIHPSMQCLDYKAFCHSCKAKYDIIDLMAMEKNMTPGEFIEWGYQYYGIPVTGAGPIPSTGPSPQGKRQDPPAPAPTPAPAPPAPEEDHTAYIDACHARISQLEPSQLRGLAFTINRFKIGYDPAWKSHGNRGTWKALIYPKGRHAFDVRNLDPKADKDHRHDKSLGAHPVFNHEVLTGEKPVFITEGIIDALSIYEAGGEAIALSGSAKEKLLQLLDKQKPLKPLILSLDNDEPGQKAQNELAEELGKRGIPFLQADLYGDCKDANEALTSGPESAAEFIKAVLTTVASIKSEEEKAREMERAVYRGITAAANLEGFFADIAKGRQVYPTGLPILDEQLKGGLFEGLTIIGAVTSAGKTTVAMQMADNMAKAGRDCLIFSLETARRELIARSLSRETILVSFRLRRKHEAAMTYRDIMDGVQGETLPPAIEAYQEYAERLYIFESLGKIGTERILDEVSRHKLITGNTPIVFVDYLQLIGPNDKRYNQGIKEIMDAAVTELKGLSVEHKTPVILISSFNRENYGKDANLASFKESGGIEYSADLLLGLQYEGAGKPGWNQEKLEDAAQADPRKMELKIMKNRNGSWGQRISLDYYAPANYFRETGVKKGKDK